MVNLDYLRELADGSVEFMEEMIDMFFEQAPESLQDIETAMAAKDYERLRAYAHKMKSSVSIMGANDLLELVKQVEVNAATNSNLDDLPVLCDKVKEETLKAIEQLKVEKEKL